MGYSLKEISIGYTKGAIIHELLKTIVLDPFVSGHETLEILTVHTSVSGTFFEISPFRNTPYACPESIKYHMIGDISYTEE